MKHPIGGTYLINMNSTTTSILFDLFDNVVGTAAIASTAPNDRRRDRIGAHRPRRAAVDLLPPQGRQKEAERRGQFRGLGHLLGEAEPDRPYAAGIAKSGAKGVALSAQAINKFGGGGSRSICAF